MVAPDSPLDDAAQSPLRAGDILVGKYRVERQIGRGGMGIVLAATHLQLEHQVAIKVLRRDLVEGDDKALNRLLAEARAAAKIRSEHVARVLDVGTLENGAPFIVMEYLEGEDLADLLDRQGALDVTVAVQFMLQSCEALAEVHAAEMVHRDLKPGNLFVAKLPDGSPSLKIVDFGISKHIGGAARGNPSTTTTTSTVLGSPYYMPPEQMRAEPVDERSDIWSLGAILFEMLTGRPPFLGDTLPEVYAAVLSGTVQPVSSLRPDIPKGLDDIVQRCLDKDPEQRFEDVAELAEALRPYGGVTSAQSVERVARILNNPQLFRGRPSPVPRPGAEAAPGGGSGTVRGGASLDPPPLAPSPVVGVGAPPSSLPAVPTVVTPQGGSPPGGTPLGGSASLVTPALVTPAQASFGRQTGNGSSMDFPLSATAASGGPFTELAPRRGKAGLRAAWGAVAFAIVVVGGVLWMRVASEESPAEPEATPLSVAPSRVDAPAPEASAVAAPGVASPGVASPGVVAPSALAPSAAARSSANAPAAHVTPAPRGPAAAALAPREQALPAAAATRPPPVVTVEALRPAAAPSPAAAAPVAAAAPPRRVEPEPEKKAKPAPTPARAAARATPQRKAPAQNGTASSSASSSSRKGSASDPWNPSSFGDRH